jgi:hypothetical protein
MMIIGGKTSSNGIDNVAIGAVMMKDFTNGLPLIHRVNQPLTLERGVQLDTEIRMTSFSHVSCVTIDYALSC